MHADALRSASCAGAVACCAAAAMVRRRRHRHHRRLRCPTFPPAFPQPARKFYAPPVLQIGGRFGAVCSNGFRFAEAQVACRSMSLAGGAPAATFPAGRVPVVMVGGWHAAHPFPFLFSALHLSKHRKPVDTDACTGRRLWRVRAPPSCCPQRALLLQQLLNGVTLNRAPCAQEGGPLHPHPLLPRAATATGPSCMPAGLAMGGTHRPSAPPASLPPRPRAFLSVCLPRLQARVDCTGSERELAACKFVATSACPGGSRWASSATVSGGGRGEQD